MCATPSGRLSLRPHTARLRRSRHEDLSSAERLGAFSLASYANSDQIAWPKTALAAARAGVPKGRYLEAREALAR
jgi:hypothetical protein